MSDDFVDIYERVTGEVVSVVPITMQDITPYGNNVCHINSIMQPWVMTESPVLGLATTAAVPVPGSGSGANYPIALEAATRFCIEVARVYTSGSCRFYDEKEYSILLERYGDMAPLMRKM